MKCPVCETTMDEGEVYLKKAFFNMLAFGWGGTDLVFKNDKSKRETELLNQWDFSKAYRCKSCGASVIATRTGRQ